MKETTPLLHYFVRFQMHKKASAESFLLFEWEITPFLKSYVSSEGAISHNVSYYR